VLSPMVDARQRIGLFPARFVNYLVSPEGVTVSLPVA
jgi:hypothetical protein